MAQAGLVLAFDVDTDTCQREVMGLGQQLANEQLVRIVGR